MAETTTEYAVQYKTFMDGEYDRTLTTDGYRKWTRETAKNEAWSFNHRRADGLMEDIARVATREVTDWVALDDEWFDPFPWFRYVDSEMPDAPNWERYASKSNHTEFKPRTHEQYMKEAGAIRG